MTRANTACAVLDSGSRLIRYAFDSAEELSRHLRFGPGLFLPDPAIKDRAGTRVIVEAVLGEDRDRPLLHGRLSGRDEGGVYVDVPSALAIARWTPDPARPRRRYRRIACDLLAEVRPQNGDGWLCRALDLCESGLRLATGSFETGVVGDEVRITLLAHDATLDLPARVAWAGVREAGVELLEAPQAFKDLLESVRSRWSDVRELRHAQSCPCSAPATRAG